MTRLQPDLAQAQRFLDLLAYGENLTFQTFSDKKKQDDHRAATPGSKQQNLNRLLYGDLSQHAPMLTQLNHQGAGVFSMVNQGDQKGRKKENVVRVRALFVDQDGAPLEPVMASAVKPHITVESSPGRFHAYWLVKDCPLEQFTQLQAALAAEFNGDPAVKDLPRVMRLPGFFHQKGEPFMTSIKDVNEGPPYAVADLIKECGLDLAAVQKAKSATRKSPLTGAVSDIQEGSRNATLTSLAGSMRNRGMSEDAMFAALCVENRTRCSPPLDDDEVRGIAISVAKYEPDPVASQPAYSRADLASMIEGTDDFDELTGRLAELIATCELREAERDTLYRLISKKAGVTLASLKQDAKNFQYSTASGDSDHITVARAVIRALGEGNLLHADGFLWIWKGDGVWRCADDRELKQIIHAAAARNTLTANVVGSVLDMVKTEVHRPGHRFDENPTAINCLNGELIFENGIWVLQPHDREHYRTAMIPVPYDPTADAPRFRQFLVEIFAGDKDAADKACVLLEAMGNTLIPSCHLEKFFMLIGPGANGKSVVLSVLVELLGRAHVSAVQPSKFEHSFQRAHLHGKLANIITEIAEGAEIADAQLKSLVSGEMTTAEHKHKPPFDFSPYAKHWFGTNHLPHTRDFSDALFRRAIILSFNNKFEGANRDVHLIDKLRAELPGILNLALAGLKHLLENNAFTECASSAEIARKWRIEADQVAQFVGDACETDKGHSVTSADLYGSYRFWADGAGIRHTLNRNNFTTRLERLGYSACRGTGGTRKISGLRPSAGGYTTD